MADYTVRQTDEMDTFYGGLFRKARAELGVTSFGMAFVELEPDSDVYPEHDHADEGQEEAYVVLAGSGEMLIRGDRIPLDTRTVVRVGPAETRKIVAGPDGIRLVAVAGVPDRAYEAPGYSELGSPGPSMS